MSLLKGRCEEELTKGRPLRKQREEASKRQKSQLHAELEKRREEENEDVFADKGNLLWQIPCPPSSSPPRNSYVAAGAGAQMALGTLTCVCLGITSSTNAQLLTCYKPTLRNSQGDSRNPENIFQSMGRPNCKVVHGARG